MNSDFLIRVIKAIIGLFLIVVLLFTVSKWWGDYKSARKEAGTESTAPPAGESTASVNATATGNPKAAIRVEVKIDGLNFRRKPAPESKPIRGLEKGEVLTVLEKQETWYQVSDKDGTKGWISSSPTYTKIVK